MNEPFLEDWETLTAEEISEIDRVCDRFECSLEAGAQPRIEENPALEQGYRRMIKAFVIYGNIPWVIMGVGILFGGVPSSLHYFNPRNGPFVLAFYAAIISLWVASFYWIFFRHGAEDLVAYPGLLNFPVRQPWMVKVFFVLALIGGVTALAFMIFANIQLPN